MKFQRTVTYEFEANDLEHADEVWGDAGPECSHEVQSVASSNFEAVTRTMRVTTNADAYTRERWLIEIPVDTPDERMQEILDEKLMTGDAVFDSEEISGERNREIETWEEV